MYQQIFRVYPEHLVYLAKMVSLVFPGQKEILATPVNLVCLDYLAKMALQVRPVSLEKKVYLDYQASLVIEVLMGYLD